MNKFLLIISVLVLAISACSKSNSNATPSGSTNSNSTPQLTALESSLVGTWVWDKMEIDSMGIIIAVQNVTSGYYCNLSSTVSTNNPMTTSLKSNFQVTPYINSTLSGTNSSNEFWAVAPANSATNLANYPLLLNFLSGGNDLSSLNLNATGYMRQNYGFSILQQDYNLYGITGYIISQTSTNLVLTTYSPSGVATGFKNYFHKQ